MVNIAEDIKTVLEFYQAMGIERIPFNMIHDTGYKIQDKKNHASCIMHRASTLNSKQKIAALKALRDEIGDCQRCKLSKGRTNLVFGEGNADAEIMFIGEGPGREEDLQGRPFVGDAGQLLTKLIEKMGFKRESVYIGNIVKCRPPLNRDPEDDEINACSSFIRRQVEIITPKAIIALGRISAQTLIGSKIPISKLRGRFYKYCDIALMPTFHPAYLLRNPKDKWLVWEDAQKVLDLLKK